MQHGKETGDIFKYRGSTSDVLLTTGERMMAFAILLTLCVAWGYTCGKVFNDAFSVLATTIVGAGLINFVFQSQGWL